MSKPRPQKHKPDPLMNLSSSYFHYGFIVLAVATLGKVFSSPGQSPCIGVIIEEVRLDVNITRSTLTGYYFAATTTSALFLPLGGKLIDRFGPRTMVTVFASGLGFACFFISWVQTPGGFHLFFALFMLRFFGQGNMMNVSICEINYWWIEKRGAVMGIAGAIVSSMMLGIIPIIMIALITNTGWRSTYQVLGMATLFFMVPMGLLFYRGKPEQYGVLPDAKYVAMGTTISDGGEDGGEGVGAVGVGAVGVGAVGLELVEKNGEAEKEDTYPLAAPIHCDPVDETNWTAKQVFHSPAFWVFVLSDLIIAGTATAFFFHLRGAFNESGVSDTMLQSIYPTLAVVSVAGRLFSGWLIDKIGQRHVMWMGLLMQSGGLALVSIMKTDALAYIVALLIGASGSFCSNVRATVYAEMYGRKHLGSVQSIASSLTVFGSAIGPFPFGVARDTTGSYTGVFAMASLFPLTAAVVVFFFGYRSEKPNTRSGFSMVEEDDEEEEIYVDGAAVDGDCNGGGEADDLIDEI